MEERTKFDIMLSSIPNKKYVFKKLNLILQTVLAIPKGEKDYAAPFIYIW